MVPINKRETDEGMRVKVEGVFHLFWEDQKLIVKHLFPFPCFPQLIACPFLEEKGLTRGWTLFRERKKNKFTLVWRAKERSKFLKRLDATSRVKNLISLLLKMKIRDFMLLVAQNKLFTRGDVFRIPKE